jgi:hypothetical protein
MTNRSLCDVVTTYTDGSKKECGKPSHYLLGDYPHPYIHTCRAHIAAGFDWIRKQEPDEHHVDVWLS